MYAKRYPVPRPRARMRAARGFTIIEVTLVVTVMLIAAAIVAHYVMDSAGSTVDMAARTMLGDFQAMRAEAMAAGEDVVLWVDTTGGPKGAPRYAVVREPTGTAPAAPPAASTVWRAMGRDIRYGQGAAVVGPEGDSLVTADGAPRTLVPLSPLVCHPDGSCDVGGGAPGTATGTDYYFVDAKDGRTPRAVRVTAAGTGTLYSWDDAGKVWR